MSTIAVTPETLALRELIVRHRDELEALFAEYGATNPRLFGSVARGEAGPGSDIDIMVDLLPEHPRSKLVRISGLNLRAREVLGHPVDVFAPEVMKRRVSESAALEATPLRAARPTIASTTSLRRSPEASGIGIASMIPTTRSSKWHSRPRFDTSR